MNKVRETSTNQLDMGSLTQIKSFDEEIKKLGDILVKLSPITEQLRNRIAALRTEASYYNGMVNADTKAFQQWFNQSNYNKQNFSGIRTMINIANQLLGDNDTDTSSGDDYAWMDACGESTVCYYTPSCNQTCSYTSDCNETEQDGYTIDDDGGVVCSFTSSCNEECGECGEITVPDPISECALPGCEDAACMQQIECGELCTQTVDCDQTVCDVCNFTNGIGTGEIEVITDCSNGYCAYAGVWGGTNPDDCNFSCAYTTVGTATGGDNCDFECTFQGVIGGGGCSLENCSFTCGYDGEPGNNCDYHITDEYVDKPCNEQINCNQTVTCTQPCGLTVCDDSAGCGETCQHNAEDCGDCFFGGCEAGDGDCGDCADCSDCAEGADCGDWGCDDGGDLCGEDCGDSCGLF